MAIRNINAPGIQLNEIDRSSSTEKVNQSLTNTSTFICGFADKGKDYAIQWIDNINTYINTYGYPENEAEKYFYNAAIEILNKRGILLTAKLPYNNKSKDKFTYVDYKVNQHLFTKDSDETSNTILNLLSAVDTSLTSYIKIEEKISDNNSIESELMTLQQLDNCKTRYNFNTTIDLNTFRIVDISRLKNKKIYVTVDKNGKEEITNVECLGLLPVVTSPINALFFQEILSSTTNISTLKTENIDLFNVIKSFRAFSETSQSEIKLKNITNDSFSINFKSDSINTTTVSKNAASLFPYIQSLKEKYLDRKYLKQIGIVLYEVLNDVSNNRITFSPVEAYVGSLDKNAKDEDTNASIFIDDIINNSSTRINLFSNVQITNNIKNSTIFYVNNQIGTVLGFNTEQTQKNITYIESILEPLTYIFDSAVDPNQIPIDIIADAGVSNIAAYVKTLEDIVNSIKNDQSISDEERKNKLAYYAPNGLIDYNPKYLDFILDSNEAKDSNNSIINISVWKTILEKYDNFARNVRKDLLFIADGLRQFCLYGYSKKIRDTDLTTSVSKQIVPYIDKLQCLNSTYSTGHCDWFLTADQYTGDIFWIPPSIKVSGKYVYNDIYYNYWSAVAGVNRGVITDIIDCAFSPTNNEAGKIYLQSWNYSVNYPDSGVVIEGQKTFQLKKTALDRVNVRRLLLYLEKQTKQICRMFLYEGNTTYNRQRLVDTLTPIFENCKDKGGLTEYIIKCDNTNNTSDVIDRNELIVTIAVKPVKVTEYIILQFITTSQAANVNEEVANI